MGLKLCFVPRNALKLEKKKKKSQKINKRAGPNKGEQGGKF